MEAVRKTAIPLAIFVALVIQIVGFSWYWLAEPLIMVLWIVPLAVFVFFTIIWSFIAIFAYQHIRRLLPLIFVTGSLALAYGFPYTTFGMHIDFKLKQQAMTEIALTAQQSSLPYDVISAEQLKSGSLFSTYKVPKDHRHLVKGENLYTVDVECGKYVFFPTFFGIPDGVGGFLFVPECASPEQFPGGRFGAAWFSVERLEGRWYRIDGT